MQMACYETGLFLIISPNFLRAIHTRAGVILTIVRCMS